MAADSKFENKTTTIWSAPEQTFVNICFVDIWKEKPKLVISVNIHFVCNLGRIDFFELRKMFPFMLSLDFKIIWLFLFMLFGILKCYLYVNLYFVCNLGLIDFYESCKMFPLMLSLDFTIIWLFLFMILGILKCYLYVVFVLSGLVTISKIEAGIQDDMNLSFKKSN